MSASLKILITVILLALCLAGYWLVDYQAKLSELEQLNHQLAEARHRLEENQARLARLPEVTERMQSLERELGLLIRQNGSEDLEHFVTGYLSDLEHLVLSEQAESGDESFRLDAVTPGQSPEKTENDALEGAPRRVFQMSFQGRYETLANFLIQLGRLRLDRLVTINKIELSPVANARPGVLQIQMPVTAYLRQGG